VVEVPTKAEFDALGLRVEALEKKMAAVEQDFQTFKDLVKTVYDLLYPQS